VPKYKVQAEPLDDKECILPNRDSTKSEFAKRLYQKMLSKGWTQSQLARYSGLNRDAVSTYIRARSLPSPVSLAKLAKTLDCPPEELLPSYYEAVVDELPARLEIKEIEAERGYMRLRCDMKLPKDLAIKAFMLLNETDN
jgi:transcriptional regulator with XRE-family HTH domain